MAKRWKRAENFEQLDGVYDVPADLPVSLVTRLHQAGDRPLQRDVQDGGAGAVVWGEGEHRATPEEFFFGTLLKFGEAVGFGEIRVGDAKPDDKGQLLRRGLL